MTDFYFIQIYSKDKRFIYLEQKEYNGIIYSEIRLIYNKNYEFINRLTLTSYNRMRSYFSIGIIKHIFYKYYTDI